MTSSPVKVGLIGAGFISDQYLSHLTTYPDLEVVRIGDLVPERARAQADRYGVPRAGTTDAVFEDVDVELIVNLTIAPVHAEIAERGLRAGKHVWNEKPLATDITVGHRLVALADELGLVLGCAPDTFLGPGIQTSLRLIADGAIGRPVAAQGIFQMAGPDRWHPDPAFIFDEGVGPLFDLSPYYFTALVQIFGPVANVSGLATAAHERRFIHTGPKAGEEFDVNVPTHCQSLLEFAGGGQAHTMFSFDTEIGREGFFEIVGTGGMMRATDPNRFDGTVEIHRDGEEPQLIDVDPTGFGRGIGAVEMARTIRHGDPHRATGRLAAYVFEVINAAAEAAASRTVVHLEPADIAPAPLLPAGWDPRASTLG